jgi:hypothetical protein
MFATLTAEEMTAIARRNGDLGWLDDPGLDYELAARPYNPDATRAPKARRSAPTAPASTRPTRTAPTPADATKAERLAAAAARKGMTPDEYAAHLTAIALRAVATRKANLAKA